MRFKEVAGRAAVCKPLVGSSILSPGTNKISHLDGNTARPQTRCMGFMGAARGTGEDFKAHCHAIRAGQCAVVQMASFLNVISRPFNLSISFPGLTGPILAP
jgi:hypothetical protein